MSLFSKFGPRSGKLSLKKFVRIFERQIGKVEPDLNYIVLLDKLDILPL